MFQIMVVEDDINARRLMQAVIEQNGYAAIPASDGAEALALMERFAFLTLGLERLELEVHMENASARRCYEKAGFLLEGVKRHAYFNDGRFSDVGVMSVLREEYGARA